MSAVAADIPVARTEVTLRLASSQDVPRDLSIRIYRSKVHPRYDTVSAAAYIGNLSIAFGSSAFERFHLDLIEGPCLWIGSSGFDVSGGEAAEIERTFAPHGLSIERRKP